jgi:C-terminal processing protease CtpA/Prc
MHHAANRCGCGKVSCQLYGIGCGHARHAMMDGRHDRMTCRQPCCAMPGMNMKMMRSGAATCEPGPRMPCCAMPEGAVKKVKKMWIEKQGQAGMKAGGHEMMKRSRRMEGTDGKKIYVIKTDPDQEHVWVESEAHARWKDQDRRVKKIRIRKPGNAKIEEIVIDDDEDEDDEAWSDDRGDEDVRIMRSGGQEIAWLGVELQDLTPELRDAFDIPAGVDGALITDVVRSGPARKWGFRRGFVVTDFNGTPIHSAEDLVEAVKASEPGDLVTVLMNRKGSTITRRVELGSRQAPVEMQRKFDIRTPDIDIEMPQMEEMGDVEHMMRSGAFLGVSAETPTDKDRQKLNAPEDMGVLITEVQENSAAEQAGLKKGDLLVKVDGDDIEDPEDLVEAITSREPGDVVTLYYMRDGEKMKADAKLGKRQLPESLRLMGRKVGSADRMEMRRYELKRELMRLHQQLQNLQDELDELNERTETQED